VNGKCLHGLVVLNDGKPRSQQAADSCIDLTFVSAELALVWEWDMMDQYTTGSDHIPVLSTFGRWFVKCRTAGTGDLVTQGQVGTNSKRRLRAWR